MGFGSGYRGFKSGQKHKLSLFEQYLLMYTAIVIFIVNLACIVVKIILWTIFDDFRPVYEIAFVLINVTIFFIIIKLTKVNLETHITKTRWAFIVVYLIDFFVLPIIIAVQNDTVLRYREYWQYALFALILFSALVVAIFTIISSKQHKP
ncbi:MAG: hypothetical protein LBU60_04310 [Clostridiales bacterium]|jgi:hypothetical protein|nr:hypothetical protein [Clostridiales bacterium]